MNYAYDSETGILTYEVTPEMRDHILSAALPPRSAEPGATALRIIEHKYKEMLSAYGRCEVRLVITCNLCVLNR